MALLADQSDIAAWAALDLRDSGVSDVRHVAGGFGAWKAAGLPVAASPDVPGDDQRMDFLFFTAGRHDGDLAASRQYLAWELDLLSQIDGEERNEFGPLRQNPPGLA